MGDKFCAVNPLHVGIFNDFPDWAPFPAQIVPKNPVSHTLRHSSRGSSPMLVATRDPMPQHGQHNASVQASAAHHGSRMGRVMLVLQLAGSFLAIPVGLASGYSIYRANFSPEITRQTPRTKIASMID